MCGLLSWHYFSRMGAGRCWCIHNFRCGHGSKFEYPCTPLDIRFHQTAICIPHASTCPKIFASTLLPSCKPPLMGTTVVAPQSKLFLWIDQFPFSTQTLFPVFISPLHITVQYGRPASAPVKGFLVYLCLPRMHFSQTSDESYTTIQ